MNGKSNGKNNVLQRNLEEENQLKEEELMDKVNTLKSISLDIQNYVKNEKSQLSKLDNDYDISHNLVKGSITKIENFMKSSYGKNTFYIVLVVMIVLFILYIL